MIEYDSKVIMPDRLCRSKFHVIARFHDYLTRNHGIIDFEFGEYFPHLTICNPTANYKLAPPILFVGKSADIGTLFKGEFGAGAFATGRTPDLGLERRAASGYEYAFENGVFCQECEAIVQFPSGPRYVPFLRYIAKYKEPNGKSMLAYAANLLAPTLQ